MTSSFALRVGNMIVSGSKHRVAVIVSAAGNKKESSFLGNHHLFFICPVRHSVALAFDQHDFAMMKDSILTGDGSSSLTIVFLGFYGNVRKNDLTFLHIGLNYQMTNK